MSPTTFPVAAKNTMERVEDHADGGIGIVEVDVGRGSDIGPALKDGEADSNCHASADVDTAEQDRAGIHLTHVENELDLVGCQLDVSAINTQVVVKFPGGWPPVLRIAARL